MTATAFEQTRRTSSTIVILITLAALLLGWGVKNAAENRTRAYSYQGVSAQLPAGWLVQQAGEQGQSAAAPNQIAPTAPSDDPSRVFTTWDPLHPDVRYSVSLYPGGAETSLATTASVRNLQRAQSLNMYRIREETPVIVEGREGYKVTFAYVNPGDISDVPAVVQGVDYYFASGDQTLVITLEIENGEVTPTPRQFLKFLKSVRVGE